MAFIVAHWIAWGNSLMFYSLCPKMIVRVPNFGKIKAHLTIDLVVVSMTLEIKKQQLL